MGIVALAGKKLWYVKWSGLMRFDGAGNRHLNNRGEMVRPWCPATRLLDQRETDAENAAADAAKRAGRLPREEPCYGQTPQRREDFPPLPEVWREDRSL